MVLAYRSDEDVLQARLSALLDERSAEVARSADGLRSVYARRVARAVSGGVAALGGAAVLLCGAAECVASGSWVPHSQSGHENARSRSSSSAAWPRASSPTCPPAPSPRSASTARCATISR